MIVYVDTSAFIPLLVEEPGSAAAGRLWADAVRVVSSRLLYVEAAAAMAAAARSGRLGRAATRRGYHELERLHGDLDLVEVQDTLVRRAAVLARRLQLRGYDAVHCASAEACADDDLVVAAGDRRLRDACGRLGLATSLIG